MTAAEATQAVAIIARHLGAVVAEFDPATCPHGDAVQGAFMTEPGETPQLLFPAGQDPAERVRTAQAIVQNRGAA